MNMRVRKQKMFDEFWWEYFLDRGGNGKLILNWERGREQLD